MPGLRAFGRRWNHIAGDDFVFPQISEAITRLTWFFVMLAMYIVHSPIAAECAEGGNISAWILGLLITYALTILLCFATAALSAQGTILNELPRTKLPYLLYIRALVLLFEFAWNVTGTVWITGKTSGCDFWLLVLMKLTLAGGWILSLCFILALFLVFDPVQHHREDMQITTQKTRTLWRNRLRILFMCARADDQNANALEDVSQLLTDFFVDSNLVVSDVWAGLLLLMNEEKPMGVRRSPVGPQNTPPPEWMNVKLADRMLYFAMGVYGWPYFLLDTPRPGRTIALLKNIKCCHSCKCNKVEIMRDNCCICNTTALLLETGLSQTEVFYASFHNSVWESPFVACADTQTQSIIVTIRGTLSLKDAVTDLCATDESLHLDHGDAKSEEIRIHNGILNNAKYVVQTLEQHSVLNDMFILYPGYNLVVTGHSLGGGVAAIVTLLLRNKYPTVRCFAFSPPGCSVSKECIPLTQDLICSVVVGDDLVPRMSYESVGRLKEDLTTVIESSTQAKYEILLRGCYRLLCGRPSNTQIPDLDAPGQTIHGVQIEHQNSQAPLLGGRARIESYTAESPPPPLHSETTSPRAPNSPAPSDCNNSCVIEGRCSLHLPGRIMHICPIVDEDNPNQHYSNAKYKVNRCRSCCCSNAKDDVESCSNAKYKVTWSNHRKFEELKLSKTMMTDHMPQSLKKVFRALTRQPETDQRPFAVPS